MLDSYAACMWLTGRYTTHVTGVWDRTSPALRSPPRREGVGHVAAKPADERGRGVRVCGAGVDGRVRETVVVGGSVQVSDLLLGDEECGMW
jgi:hypothetical protein